MSCWLIIDFSSIRIVVISFLIRKSRRAFAARRLTTLTRVDTYHTATFQATRVRSVSLSLRLRMPFTGSLNAVAAVVPCAPGCVQHAGVAWCIWAAATPVLPTSRACFRNPASESAASMVSCTSVHVCTFSEQALEVCVQHVLPVPAFPRTWMRLMSFIRARLYPPVSPTLTHGFLTLSISAGGRGQHRQPPHALLATRHTLNVYTICPVWCVVCGPC